MTQLLLTGAGGSIGCHMLEHLLVNTDWRIACIDSFRHKGLTDRIVEILKRQPGKAHRVRVFTHDLAAPLSDGLIRAIGMTDYVVAMASLSDVGDSITNPAPFVLGNVQAALNSLEYARIVRPETFLLVSTDEVYGPTDGAALRKEWDSILPSSAYAASKAAQEAIAVAYWRSYHVPLVIVNLVNNFGEMQSPVKFPSIVQRKILAGETVPIHARNGEIGSRFYLHSRTAADAMLFLLRNLMPPLRQGDVCERPERFHIVGDRSVGNLELAQMIAGIMDRPLRYELVDADSCRPGHDPHYGLDGSKLAAFGWRSPSDFEESLGRTVRWHMAHPRWLLAGQS